MRPKALPLVWTAAVSFQEDLEISSRDERCRAFAGNLTALILASVFYCFFAPSIRSSSFVLPSFHSLSFKYAPLNASFFIPPFRAPTSTFLSALNWGLSLLNTASSHAKNIRNLINFLFCFFLRRVEMPGPPTVFKTRLYYATSNEEVTKVHWIF